MELLNRHGYNLPKEQFIEVENYIENIINRNPKFNGKVEILRGNKLRGTILDCVLTDKDDKDYVIADLIIDVDEVELEVLWPIWNTLAVMNCTQNEFKTLQHQIDMILEDQGAFIWGSCIIAISTDMEDI